MIMPQELMGEVPKFKIRNNLRIYFLETIKQNVNAEKAKHLDKMITNANEILNSQHLAKDEDLLRLSFLLMLGDSVDFLIFFIAGASEELLQKYAELQGLKFYIPKHWQPYL